MSAADDPLVSTEWLAARLDDPRVKVLDASFKLPGATPLAKEDFLAAHIPGAAFFDVDEVADKGSPLPHMFPTARKFGDDVGALGIGNDDTVVLYDAGTWMASARAWWMFLSFGHRDVRILDGGLKTWLAEGRPVESGPAVPKPAEYQATFNAAGLRDRAAMEANVASREAQVIDARARDRFEGRVAEPRPGLRSGHIPGSLNLPFNELVDPATGKMKPLGDLRAAFAAEGADLARPIVTSCGSGVSAAVLTLALYRLGVRGSALYDGSWSEWGLADGPALATGKA